MKHLKPPNLGLLKTFRIRANVGLHKMKEKDVKGETFF